MKRVKVSPGRFVLVRDEIITKMEKALRDQSLTPARLRAAIELERRAKGGALLKPPTGRPRHTRETADRRVLVAMVLRILGASSSEMSSGDLERWTEAWMHAPNAQLRDKTPADVLREPNGAERIQALLEAVRGGLPG